MPTFDTPFDPDDPRSQYGAQRINVSSMSRTDLQRLWEAMARARTMQSDQLTDLASASVGRPPIFHISSRFPGFLGHIPYNAPSFDRAALARRRLYEFIPNMLPQVPRAPGLVFPAYRPQPRRYFGASGPALLAPEYNPAGFPMYRDQPGVMRGRARLAESDLLPIEYKTERLQMMRLFKDIDATLHSMDRTERRVLYVTETSAGVPGRTAANLMRPWSARWAQWIGAPAPSGGGGPPIPPGLGIPRPPPGSIVPPPTFPPIGGGGAPPGGGGGSFGGGRGRGGSLGNFGPLGIIAGAALDVAEAPGLYSAAIKGGFTRALPYANLLERWANITRLQATVAGTGRQPRQSLENMLVPNAGFSPQELRNLGLTPEAATSLLERLGGLRPGQNATGLLTGARNLRLGAGFTGAPAGAVTGLERLGMSLGMGTKSPDLFPKAFADFLQQGKAGGADINDLLETIAKSTESMAKLGIKLDPSQAGGWADFLRRSMMVDMPLAQRGVLGGQILQGVAGLGQQPFRNQAATLATVGLVSSFNWHDVAGLQKMMGRSLTPDELQDVKNLQRNPMNPVFMQRGIRLLTTSKHPEEVIKRLSEMGGRLYGRRGQTAKDLIENFVGQVLGGDYQTGRAAIEASRMAKPPPLHAGAPAPGTTPEVMFRAAVDAFVEGVRGFRATMLTTGHLGTASNWFSGALGSAFGWLFSSPFLPESSKKPPAGGPAPSGPSLQYQFRPGPSRGIAPSPGTHGPVIVPPLGMHAPTHRGAVPSPSSPTHLGPAPGGAGFRQRFGAHGGRFPGLGRSAPRMFAGEGGFIKSQEGLVLSRYNDVGHPAIGYGHDITSEEMHRGYIRTDTGNVPISGRITRSQADAIFRADYSQRLAHVSRMVPGFSSLNANQREAIMSYYYNTGRLPRHLSENIAHHDMSAISESIRHGIATVHGRPFAPLVRRRSQEASLFDRPPDIARSGLQHHMASQSVFGEHSGVGGGGGELGSDARSSLHAFSRAVQEAAEHVHELGHASRRARSGMQMGGTPGGPNTPTAQGAQPRAYPS